ncbi:gliding motility-associated C-terminal domain-containing protein [Chitinophaga qingshengii]|uniref:Gliding motility-associated C-terminal domain-containing protein n=1 Tax=Chitinophaga qingshengii TaxID=1569794 RepID=A0ABR7TQ71_9BACT|nr:gliding motility-associated C-terminal domain-containing protein [Chitinophaga qingshengii]MBC9932629.1 gliding motility-associated C-terminal domain-containing protein [Chitinophaga qingshengii]
MRNYTLSFIHKTLLVAALLLILGGRLLAQTDISIGNSTSGNTNTGYPCPLQDYYEGNRSQFLYTAAELTAAGMAPGYITGIKFFVKNLNDADVIEQYGISIGSTTTASLSGTSWETGTTVVRTPADYTIVAGVNSFPFSSNFFWNGTDNIVIEVCSGSPNSTTGSFYSYNPEVPSTTGLTFNGSHTYRADNEDNLCGTASTTNNGTQTSRPDITFSWIAATACTGTPTGGTAVTSSSSVCLNGSFDLRLNGATVASGLTYQWQQSTDNITWTNITGATKSTLTTTQSATTWYRCVVTCTASTQSATSTAVNVTSPALVTGTFSINKALPTGSGNFASFNDAYNYLKCGISGPVVFNVVAGSGPYNEQLLMNPIPGASATNTVTFNGNGDTLKFNATSANRGVIQLDNADYITFNNLVIKAMGNGTSGYGWGVFLTNDADFNTISNCTILVDSVSTSSTNYAGIVISSSYSSPTTTGDAKCDNNTFTGNKIVGGYYGIALTGSSTMANMSNKISNNTITEFYYAGINAIGSFNTLIENNNISRPARSVVSSFYGIYFSNLNTKANITRNRISNPFGGALNNTNASYGIYFSGTDALSQLENVVSNNVIYNFTGKGDAYGIYNSSSDNVWYFHNTIVLDGTSTSATTYTTRGFYQTSQADGIEFLNNLIAVTRGGGGSKYAVYFGTTTGTIHANNNLYYMAAAGGTSYTGYYTANRSTLLDWQTASRQDTASLSSNPLFAGAAAGNYQPTSASIDNKGLPAGITVDINSNTRSTTTPDIGAYEFTPGPCTTPPTPGDATVGATPVCINRKVALSLINNSIGLGQTYQWQTATVAAGPYTNMGNPMTNPDTTITSSATLYYRVAVTCSGNTAYSTPVLLTVNPAFPGGTYTINKGAPSSATNFVSFNAAKAAMECGIAGPVIFNVVAGSGPYAEQLILDSITGMSATNTVTFNGNGNTIKFAPTDDNERAVIKLRAADYITFDSLIIDARGGSNGYGVHMLANADNNRITRCSIIIDNTSSSSGMAGIVINGADGSTSSGSNNGCDNNLLRGNDINGGYYGIVIYGSSSSAATGNRIENNTIREFYSYGVYLTYADNAVVDHNDIFRATRSSISYSNYGISVNSKGDGAVISNNRIHGLFNGAPATTNSFYGIEFSSADAIATNPAKIINNVVYDIKGGGTQRAFYNYSSDFTLYYHNTVVLNDNTNTGSAETSGLYQSSAVAGVEFKDNILDISRAGSGSRTGLYISNTAEIKSDYNDIFVKSSRNTAYTGYNGTNYITLADWRAGAKLDSNSLAIQPVFADPSTGNFAPVISPLDNTGRPVGVTTDILGVSRSATTPDMGAFEINIPECTSPPVAGAATLDPTTPVCMGTAIKLDLAGNSKGGHQTYQWQVAASAAGPWKYVSDTQYVSVFNTIAGVEKYYRCAVVCSNRDTVYSTPVVVNLNDPLLAGTYTINPAQPSSTTNFQSFAAAVSKLECGIAGPVLFLAANGTYTEQLTMHHIPGATATSRVTFSSASGNAADVTITYAGTSTLNYVLKLDSVDYVTWKNISFKPTGATYARAVEFAKKSSWDSLSLCNITLPVTTATGTNSAGVYANNCLGQGNVISGNNITAGGNGVYWLNNYGDNISPGVTIDSNTITKTYNYGIYADYVNRLMVRKNTINLSGALASTVYGIYADESDTAITIVRNKINISNTTSKGYAIYLTYCQPGAEAPGVVNGNEIYARTANTGEQRGLTLTSSSRINVNNNVVSIHTTATSSYGLYSEYGKNLNYLNNSILNTSTGNSNHYAAYFSHTSSSASPVKVRNNIFAADTGRATYIANPNFVNSDYNTLYTAGSVLVRQNTPAASYGTLAAYRTGSGLDANSIVYKPAFVSSSDLHPVLSDPEVWAIHGRGVQVPGNDKDINGDPRPVTLQEGVPDMGAYEFLPTSVPPALPAFPATPAAGVTQTFMFGTDTVTKITWNNATLPSNMTVRRYSGVKPPNVATGTDFMYFYTDVDVTPGSGVYNFNIQQYYLDPWQGYIKRQKDIRLARTDSTDTWITDSLSRVDDLANVITDSTLHYFDKFTGLNGGINTPQQLQPADSSNRGTRFWVGYGHHQFFTGDNSQQMVLYLNAKDSANVTVRVNGTSWVRTYHIPANKTITTEVMPKGGSNDARLLDEGWSDRGISIESDIPIVAYAHIYGSASSGATMLLPVGTYGYDYYALTSRQNYSTDTYSWFYVMADYDNTTVEITPSVPTLTGRPANQTFTVTLNKGEVYQVLGALQSGSEGYDVSGSHVRSIVNSDGKCFPVAVFSGSSRTGIGCDGSAGSSGDNIIQQNFPSQAWGKKYLTAPTSIDDDAASFMTNIYRVLVKDTATVVKVNGIQLRGLINKRFYQYQSNTADYIEASQPVMVAQYMSSSGSCDNTWGDGDPEMIYISPLEQGIKAVGLYRNTVESINTNYLTLIIPTGGLSSLRIDGTNLFDHTYAHPNLSGYTVVVKRWDAAAAQCNVVSDSAFTAITYGLGSVESYGYNAGTLVKNLNILPAFSNVLNPSTGSNNTYTCVKTPFRFSMLIPVKPTVLTWKLSAVKNLTPAVDVVQNNPVPKDSITANERTYYRYVLPDDYVFSAPGTYYVPIQISHPDIESCNNSFEAVLSIKVIPAPVVDFTTAYSGCIGDAAQFTGSATTSNNVGINSWNWNFGDTTAAYRKDTTKQFKYPGIHKVKLSIVAAEGCIGDTTKEVEVYGPGIAVVVKDSMTVCSGTDVSLAVKDPEAGVLYNWYDAPTGGNLLFTGNVYTITAITVSGNYYLEAINHGCPGDHRAKVVVHVLPLLATPVVKVDTVGVNMIRFKWDAVPNATGYEVSTDGGLTWTPPSSGREGLEHLITGLQPTQTVKLIVKVRGCEDKISDPAEGKTLPDGIYIPNAFTPNNDAKNDVLKVYGYIINKLHIAIFDQWGEKVFESNSQDIGWDGTYKGKPMPSGVYVYVCHLVLKDGTSVEKKGVVNLIR